MDDINKLGDFNSADEKLYIEDVNENILNEKKPKDKKRRSISDIIIRKITRAFIFSFVILIFFSVSFTVVKLNTESTVQINNSSNIVAGMVTNFVNEKIRTISQVATRFDLESFSKASTARSMQNYSDQSYSDITKNLEELCNNDGDIQNAWLMSANNKVLITNQNIRPLDGVMNTSSWQKALENDVSGNNWWITEVIDSSFVKDRDVIVIVRTVYIDDLIVGYLGVEVKPDSLFSMLDLYSENSACFPVISTRTGTLVYKSNSKDFEKVFDQQLNLFVHSANYEPNGINTYKTNGLSKSSYYLDNISNPNWNILVFFDYGTIGNDAKVMTYAEAILFVFVVIFLYIVVSNNVYKELSMLKLVEEKIKSMLANEHNEKLVIKNEHAFSDLAEDLNKLSTSMREISQKVIHYTNNDILTDLPNRIKLYEDLETIIGNCKDNMELGMQNRFAVLFIDIDNFKWLNENLGHDFGDSVLWEFANIISNSLDRKYSIYRFSGDEFIILVPFGEDYEEINHVITQLRKLFENSVKILTNKIYIKYSMGISIFPDDDWTIDMLLRDADYALHKAKENGKGQVELFTDITKKHKLSRALIAQNITNALKYEELYLDYQPIISTESCDIHGFEALLRWNSYEYGNIPPDVFIGVAELTGDIVPIGTWIFESACRFLKKLCDNYRDDIIMSINVSPVQLKRPDYIEHVKRVIEITQVNPKNIQIEITESSLIDYTDNSSTVISDINDLGITIALDDFGTGYSSLNYLKKFPIKCLKIDKTFIDEINKNDRDYAITDSIIDLVHTLEIKTVAEGIETFDQYSFLKDMKCDYIQGFLMSKPLNEDTALDFVKMYDDLHKPNTGKLKAHEIELENERIERQKSEEAKMENEKSTHSDFKIENKT